MPARDDAGSDYGRPGGSQNSGVHNGGVAGGMGGGFGGGGAGRNGGYNSSTGLRTGKTMKNSTQRGRPGGISEELAALYKSARPKGARPTTQAPPPPTYVAPPPVAPPPPKYPVGTLAKAMWDNIFNGPTARPPSNAVPDEAVPGYGQTYTPPATLPYGKAITDRVPQDPNYPGNTFDHRTGHVGRGKQYTDRVPQGDRYGKK